jgi:hypothetical protein
LVEVEEEEDLSVPGEIRESLMWVGPQGPAEEVRGVRARALAWKAGSVEVAAVDRVTGAVAGAERMGVEEEEEKWVRPELVDPSVEEEGLADLVLDRAVWAANSAAGAVDAGTWVWRRLRAETVEPATTTP